MPIISNKITSNPPAFGFDIYLMEEYGTIEQSDLCSCIPFTLEIITQIQRDVDLMEQSEHLFEVAKNMLLNKRIVR